MGLIGYQEALAIAKIAAIVLVWYLQQRGAFAGEKVWLLVCIHVFYAGVIAWNSYQLFKASRT
jgi:hypothetical protein